MLALGARREEKAPRGSLNSGRMTPPGAQLLWSPEQMATLSPGVCAQPLSTHSKDGAQAVGEASLTFRTD